MGKEFTKVKAIFKPKNLETLRPELQVDIGKEFIFQYAWLMEDDDMFPDIWALISRDEKFVGFGLWIPEFDLEIINS